MKLKIEYINIKELKEYEYNSKLHPDEQIQLIADSIAEFGMNDPIAVDENMTIIEGHGRLKALQLMEETTCPIIRLEHMTQAQKKAYIIGHNKLTMSSGFDIEILEQEIQSIRELDEDMDLTIMGFDAEEISDILGEEIQPIEGLTDDDYVPDEPEIPCIKFGDLIEFEDGSKILCGDSTDKKSYKKILGKEKADMVFTDPPYGVAYQTDKHEDIANDDLTGDSLRAFLIDTFKNLFEYTKENPALYIFYASKTHIEFEEALTEAGFRVKQQLIWEKPMFALGRSDYHWKHEPMMYAVKNDNNSTWYGDRCKTTIMDKTLDIDSMTPDEALLYLKAMLEDSTVWKIARDSVSTYQHPTQKPTALAERGILNSSIRGHIVLEPFSGSGSTLIASLKTGRRCYAIEFEPKYVEVAIQRHVEYTGKQDIKINGKKIYWEDYKND